MTYNWFKLFSLPEFMATGLVSRKLFVILDGYGQREILITRGNVVSILYLDTFLPVSFLDRNPYVRAGDAGTYAVYKDADDYVWLGIGIPHESSLSTWPFRFLSQKSRRYS